MSLLGIRFALSLRLRGQMRIWSLLQPADDALVIHRIGQEIYGTHLGQKREDVGHDEYEGDSAWGNQHMAITV